MRHHRGTRMPPLPPPPCDHADGLLSGVGVTLASVCVQVWAYANLGIVPSGNLLDEFARMAMFKIAEFSPQNVSNFLWAFAKLNVPKPELFEAGELFKPANIGGRAHGGGIASGWEVEVLGVQQARRVRGIGPPWHVCMAGFRVSFACPLYRPPKGTLSPIGLYSPTAILMVHCACYACWPACAAGQHAGRVMHTFQPQSIANMIWAFATLAQCPDAAFLQPLVAHALRMLPDFSPQNLSNTAWAFATLKDCDSVKQFKSVSGRGGREGRHLPWAEPFRVGQTKCGPGAARSAHRS